MLSPLIKGAHYTTKFFSELFFSIKEIRDARKQNKILKEKVMWQEIKIGRLLIENIYYKQLYGFEEKEFLFNYITKTSILRMDTPAFSSRLILPLGKSKGIKERYICITPEGVVGKITKVEANLSYLLPIVNSESVVSVVCERTGVHGVLKGDSSGFLQLKYLPPYSEIREDDLVLTDSWDYSFPYGLKIGTIFYVEKQADELIVKVKPSVDFTKLNYVYIIKGVED